ncbi:class IV adenylate cyclase [Streptomyces anulatus]|uniref:class IV adenylate cyclase n=1 Tax=Streptomyces anulatus TaxID=1892 RepID=UPI0022561130|nr:class IV adenylate cyclase [Streptomyces anulatus]MCX4490014.1 class IV adenylate cyclase [Streptomyces anulatus]
MAHTIEVERKRELPDDGSILTPRLTQLGYIASAPMTEVDTYYSRPDVDYMLTVECLRIRHRGNFAEITYKPASTPTTHAHDHVISKVETNVILSEGEQARTAERLLISIGMREIVRVEKTRTTYTHPETPGVTVSIDAVNGAGTFVETEVNRPTSDGATEIIEHIESQLEIVGYPTVSLPYRDLVLRSRESPIVAEPISEPYAG